MEHTDSDNSYNDNEDVEMSEPNDSTKNFKSKKNNKKKLYHSTDEFLDYFESYKVKGEFLNTENPDIKNYDFTIDKYSDLIDKNMNNLDKTFVNSKAQLLSNPDYIEKINGIDENLFIELIISLLKIESNILIYGLGSKLRLMYDFMSDFQMRREEFPAYNLLVFNCYNPEITLKSIVKEISKFLDFMLKKLGNNKKFSNAKSIDEELKRIEELISYIRENIEYKIKLIIIINDIGGPHLANKTFQKSLSILATIPNINIIATCEYPNIIYLWPQNIKENYKFYFLKFNTFETYDVEINDFNNLSSDKGIKSGIGLVEIFKSFNRQQKELLKELALVQLKDDIEMMTPKGFVDYLINKGIGICNNIPKLNELISEAKDHNIVISKLVPKTNKEIYKLNLDKEVIEKLANGEYEK